MADDAKAEPKAEAKEHVPKAAAKDSQPATGTAPAGANAPVGRGGARPPPIGKGSRVIAVDKPSGGGGEDGEGVSLDEPMTPATSMAAMMSLAEDGEEEDDGGGGSVGGASRSLDKGSRGVMGMDDEGMMAMMAEGSEESDDDAT